MTDWYDSTASATLTVRVGQAGAIETNPDPSDSGNTWTAQTSGVVIDLYGIAYNGIGFVAVGASGTGVYSVDAVTWAVVTTQSSEDLNSIATGGNVFIAVGNAGDIVQSQNGTVWSTIASGITDDLWDIAIGNAVYVAVGDNDAVVVGNVTSTVLEVHLLESIFPTDTLVDNGKFNFAASETILTDDAVSRTKNIADNRIYQAVFEGMTFDQDLVQDVDADPQTGTDESIAGSSEVVVTEGLNVTSNNYLIAGGAGSGEPHFVTVLDSVYVTQFGNFEDAKFNKALTDTIGMSERIFDSFTKVMEVIGFSGAAQGAYHKLLLENITVDDLTTFLVVLNNVVTETVTLADTHVVTGKFTVAVIDDIAMDDTLTTNQIFELVVSETILSIAGVNLPDDGAYLGLCINTRNKAITEYEDFDFNSMFMFNNEYYGVNSEGVHKIEGKLDGTDNIAAAVKTGLMDMGDTLSRVSRAYIGMKNDGQMVLKTFTTDPDGVKRERYYEIVSTSEAMRTARVRTLKKVKSKYWQFELVNIDGADFQIADIDFVNIKLTRRI